MFGLTRAPELKRPGQTWFNVDAPLRLSELRGRVVILDFWTFCCVNCHHVLPILRRIEERFPTEVAVVGVHSPKFDAERQPENLAQAIARHDIRHPVVHDPEMRLWDEYAVRAWPTLVLISPDGHVIGQLSGEPDPDRILDGLACMISGFMERGELRPCLATLRPPPTPAGRLSFPGKIRPLARPTDDGAHWALADTGHHQIVLLAEDGREVRRIGGPPGLRDGQLVDAGFQAPQGMAAAGPQSLYVADTGNHALRLIDLDTGTVRTLAGNGGRGLPIGHTAPADQTMLASPWDVAVDGSGDVLIANAGTHQILAWSPDSGTVHPIAGTGGENIVDGPAPAAFLAQPSGLTFDPTTDTLWFVDAETSAIRALRLGAGRVETLVGQGLFVFGRTDGPVAEARLQHPLDIACLDGRLIVADSYNDVLRCIDPAARTVETLILGTALREPAGLCAAGPDRLLVSDTNNHRVLEVTPSTGATRVWSA